MDLPQSGLAPCRFGRKKQSNNDLKNGAGRRSLWGMARAQGDASAGGYHAGAERAAAVGGKVLQGRMVAALRRALAKAAAKAV
jgi:hypothetical protein